MTDGSPTSSQELLADPRLLSVLGATFVGTFGLAAISPVLPAIANALSVSDARIGLVFTAFVAANAVTLPLAGYLADAYGRRVVIVASLLLFGVAGVATYFAPTFGVLLTLRALQGMAFPGVVSLSITVIGDVYSLSTGTAAQGLRMSVNGVSATVAPLLAGALAAVAWNVPFLLFAIAFPAAVVVLLYLPETGDPGRREDGGQDRLATERVRGHLVAVASELRNVDLSLLLVGAFVFFFARYAVVTFVPLLAVRTLGATSFVAGLLISLLGVVRIVVPPTSRAVVSRLSLSVTIVASIGLTAVSILAMAVAPSPLVLGCLVGGFAVGGSLFNSLLNATVAGMASDENRASVVVTMELAKSAAVATSPIVLGVVLALSGYDAVFMIPAAGLLVFGGVAAAWLGLEDSARL